MEEMRAALYDRYGAPDVLYIGMLPIPKPKTGEILVRVHAVSVNSIDTVVRAGKLRLFTGRKFPRGTSLDFAGEITAVGDHQTNFEVGDHVWGTLPRGSWGSAAEFISLPERCVVQSPKEIDLILAAALPVVGATALLALREVAKLQQGESLLVRGASGGVGLSAVQLGRAMGATITGIASTPRLPFVRELGADRAVSYETTHPSELGSFDVILDTVGSDLASYRQLLAPGGRMVTVAIDSKSPVRALLYIVASTVFGRRRVRFFSAEFSEQILRDLTKYVDAGAIRPVIDTVYLLTEIREAHLAVEAGGKLGKQIVTLV